MSDPAMGAAPVRVTHVIPQIGIGGAELQLCRLIKNSPRGRVEHRVLYYSDSQDHEGFEVFRHAGIPLLRVDRRGGPLAFVTRLARAIAAGEPDIVHCWLVSAIFWGRCAAALARSPRIVLSFRNTHIDLRFPLQMARLADWGRIHYLANSSATADSVACALRVARARVAVIHNGLDLGEYTLPANQEGLRREHRCPPGTRLVLTVGRLSDQKNYPMLLRVAALCRDQVPAHFLIAGHGEREADLRALADDLGVAETVHFLGLRRDLPALLASADLFSYTARFEGLPNALLEAMAAARPIVTTRFAGVDEIVEDSVNGLVVPQDDAAAAFEAIRSLLADPDHAAALGRAARRTVETRFSTERMVQATLEYYERLMSGAG